MLGQLKGHDDLLKDKDSSESDQPPYAKNEYRARLPEVLVLIGTCTHLGCLPKQRFEAHSPEMGAYWPGGFFCPCHGSRFDLAGRVFNGSPASVNLKVPPYEYPSPLKLVVGVDETHKGAA
jgi:ubiquinol-cytochrome c reductase iron-sulfur subunit